MPVAEHLKDHYYCILPTSTVYCSGQRYHSKADELLQIENYLKQEGISSLALVVASSLGADLAAAFLSKTQLPVSHVFFDGAVCEDFKRHPENHGPLFVSGDQESVLVERQNAEVPSVVR